MASSTSSYYDEFLKKQAARPDTQKFMTDRNAYMAYLEVQLDKTTRALGQVKDMDDRMRSCEDKVTNVARLVKMQASMHDAAVGEVKTEVARMREQMKEWTDSAATVDARLSGAESRFKNLLSGCVDELKTLVARSEDDAKRCSIEVSDVRHRVASFEQDIAVLKDRVEDAVAAVAADLRTEFSGISKSLRDMQRDMSALRDECTRLCDDAAQKVASVATQLVRSAEQTRVLVNESRADLDHTMVQRLAPHADAVEDAKRRIADVAGQLEDERGRRRNLEHVLRSLSESVLELPDGIEARVDEVLADHGRRIAQNSAAIADIDARNAGNTEELERRHSSLEEVSRRVEQRVGELRMEIDRLAVRVNLVAEKPFAAAAAGEMTASEIPTSPLLGMGLRTSHPAYQHPPAPVVHPQHELSMIPPHSARKAGLGSPSLRPPRVSPPPGSRVPSGGIAGPPRTDDKIASLEGSLRELRQIVSSMEGGSSTASSSSRDVSPLGGRKAAAVRSSAGAAAKAGGGGGASTASERKRKLQELYREVAKLAKETTSAGTVRSLRPRSSTSRK